MEPGDRVGGRFELEAFVARGGMGEVWRAIDRITGKTVALKLLSEHTLTHVQRALREARALRTVNHPVIVDYVAHEIGDDQVFLATEWIDGCSLSTKLRGGPLPVSAALDLAEQLAIGLGHAHDHGLVHRDVKPGNIMLAGGDPARPRLIDFGIVHGAAWDPLTRTGASIGTPSYMAPEQVRGAEVTPATDLFSLGCVLFKVLSGRAPYRGNQAGVVMAQIAMFDEPPRLQPNDRLPSEVVELVAALMRPRPDDRPASGADAAARIRTVREVLASRRVGDTAPRTKLSSLEVRPVAIVFARLNPAARITTFTYSQFTDSRDAPPADRDEQLVQAMRVSPRQLAVVRRLCTAFEAEVESVGDGALAARLLGGASVLDLAVRAARCALAIAEALPSAAVGASLDRAVIDDHTGMRELIASAVSLVDRDQPGVVVDDRIRDLLPARFQVDGAVLRAEDRSSAAAAEPPRLLLGKRTACVGRNRLLRQLTAAFAGCVDDLAADAFVVVGPAGVGKSRLRAELVSRLTADHHPLTVIAAWGDPLRSQAPHGLLGDAVRQHAGITGGDDTAQRDRLRALAGDGDDADRIAEFLGELAGIPFDAADSPRLRAARSDPELMASQIRRAFEDWMLAQLSRAPVLLLVDDLQWADEPSVDLIAGLLRRAADSPLMVFALGRPELQNRFPELGDSWNRQEIVLDTLRPADSARIVDEALGDRVDPDTRDQLVARSGGNPFYLEELVRAVATGELGGLPDSIVSSIQLRIARLPEIARRLLRAGSIYGRRFDPRAARALLDDPIPQDAVDDWLVSLCRDELIEPIGTGFQFRHDLTREAAYRSLTERDRVTGHRQAGYYLRAAGETDPLILAEHFSGGGAFDRDAAWFAAAAERAAEGDDEAAEALGLAADYLFQAGQAAARNYANHEATRFFEVAAAVFRRVDPLRATRALLDLADVRERLDQRLVALAELREALDWTNERLPDVRTEILLKRSALEVRSDAPGAINRALEAAEEARSLACKVGRQDLEADALSRLAASIVSQDAEGSSALALEYAERALELASDNDDVAQALWRLGNVLLLKNDLERASSIYSDALALAESARLELLIANCRANLGLVAFRRWDTPAAIQNTKLALHIYRQVGYATRIVETTLNLGTFYNLAGQRDAARRLLEDALGRGRGDWIISTLSHEILADIERHHGNGSMEVSNLRRAIEACGRVGAREKRAHYCGLLAESLWRYGAFAECVRVFEQSADQGAAALSRELLRVWLGLIDNQQELLGNTVSEADPDRRLLTLLARARVAVAGSRWPQAQRLCEQAQSSVPSNAERFYAPTRVVAACAARDLGAALEALDHANRACGDDLYPELVTDVGQLIAGTGDAAPDQLEQFLALSGRSVPAFEHRIQYLRGLVQDRLGDHTAAAASFARARAAADRMLDALPDDYRATLREHPWMIAIYDQPPPLRNDRPRGT